ncbi:MULTISPECIES: DinB family protein [unclassified Peribacillus]|uniref:DinB family protein n=1 Tax=unclassified Peribacillus TaxID=2675266 RepID=UPI001911AB36|nr:MULTISPECIES: DinB family protein [unclassified Peribacillus]MBK5445630.1 DinB family protein [Peribacillus sp. TH24]MBK5459652.1 DinB family protein [Peribacillus sp. TH27]MBK5481460.1 DinB family protein [Peribacillus sp. TH16]MBK5497841.1 DinB family protein [Peribacillus sp. TH14]
MEDNKKIREELLEAVNNLSDEQLNAHPEEGRWSIIQVLNHLYLMERVITKSIADKLKSDESIPAEDKPIEYTLNREVKVSAPPFVIPSEAFQTLDEVKNKLSESRQAFIQVVDSANEKDLEQKSFPHPLFKELSLKQWIPFVGLHEKRHLLQIEELKSKL